MVEIVLREILSARYLLHCMILKRRSKKKNYVIFVKFYETCPFIIEYYKKKVKEKLRKNWICGCEIIILTVSVLIGTKMYMSRVFTNMEGAFIFFLLRRKIVRGTLCFCMYTRLSTYTLEIRARQVKLENHKIRHMASVMFTT